jgi:RNA polymerase sigma factor (sigma-70 family)
VAYLRQLIDDTSMGDQADSVLLSRYATSREEAAFALLVRRHGPLVLRVCRQVALQAHDADDAFQATFLVLARRAGSIRRREALAGWLYRVAYHVALQTRSRALVRQKHERQAARVNLSDTLDPAELTGRQELTALVHEEINRLPARYRLPVLLCYLGDRTNEEAAGELGLPVGTVKVQLLRARERLRSRLARRGVTLSGGMLPGLLVGEAGAATLPATVIQGTVQAALHFAAGSTADVLPAPAALANGVLKTAWLTKGPVLIVLAFMIGTAAMAAGALFVESRTTSVPIQFVLDFAAADEPGIPPAEKPPQADLHGDALPVGALARLGTTRWRMAAPADFVGFLDDGRQLLTVSQDGTCQVWEAASGRQLRRFGSPGRGWNDVALSPDGSTLATANTEGKVILWEVASGRSIGEFQAAPNSWPPEVVFAADGKSLFTTDSSKSGQITRWDAGTGKLLRRFDEPPYPGHAIVRHGCPCLLHSAGGQQGGVLVSLGYEEGQVRNVVVGIWDTETGKPRRVIRGIGGKFWLSAVALSTDGKLLAWASESGQFRLHDLAADKQLFQMDREVPETQFIIRCIFSRDGTLATQLADGTLRLWDSTTGKPRPQKSDLTPEPLPFVRGVPRRQLAFTPDGKTLAAGSSLHLVRLLNLDGGEPGKVLPLKDGHSADVRALLLSSDGREICTQDRRGQVRRWDVATGKPLPTPMEKAPNGPRFLSADGRILAVCVDDNRVSLRQADSGEEISALRLPALDQRHKLDMQTIDIWSGVLFTPDGQTAVTRGRDRQTLLLWQVSDGKELRPVRVQRQGLVEAIGSGRWIPGFGISDVALLADGATLAVSFWGHYGKANPFDLSNRKDEIIFFALKTGQENGSIRLTEVPPRRLAASPTGRVLATSDGKNTISLLELASGQQRVRFTGQGDCLAFSPDGRVLAAAGADGIVRAWDLWIGKEVALLTGHRGPVHSLVFTPDGRKLISGSADTTALVWDAANLVRKDAKASADLSTRELETLWSQLAADPVVAYKAMQRLHAARQRAVALLKERVRPILVVEAGHIEQWLADLGSPEFAVREQATAKLETHGEQALPALKKALEGKPEPETRRRLEQLVENQAQGRLPSEAQRCLRAAELLEALDVAAARETYDKLARGAAGSRLTQEARASLKRLK